MSDLSSLDETKNSILMSSKVEFEEISGVDERSEAKKINARLVQINRILNIAQKITVYNDRFMKVECNRMLSKKKFTIDLTWLKSTPRKALKISWAWLVMTAVFGILANTLHSAPESIPSAFIAQEQVGLVKVGMIALAVFSFVLFLLRSHMLLQFNTWHGNLPVVSLLNNTPSKKEFQPFLQGITKMITKLQSRADQEGPTALARELKEHRVLKENGALTEAQYEKAKRKLFANH